VAILNLNQFLERVETPFDYHCDVCKKTMQEVPLTTKDALKIIFMKKIVRRFECISCKNQIKVEK
jgi:ribosomal protein L44E